MKTKTIALALTAILTISLIIFFYPKSPTQQTSQSSSSPETQSISKPQAITLEELSLHNTEEDCWIVYDNKVYDYTSTGIHPNMAKTFYSHCGDTTFQEAAIARHGSRSSETRTASYGEYVGELAQ